VSLRAERSNPIHDKIKSFEIAASLTLLAMTAGIEFFRKLLELKNAKFGIKFASFPSLHFIFFLLHLSVGNFSRG
jgi:hypothetical protein